MAEDFANISSKIALIIRRQGLTSSIVENFLQFTNQIIEQGVLSHPNSDKTDQFLNETVPKVASVLLSSLAMNSTQLQFSIQIVDCLNRLALWAMLKNKENLVNALLVITNSNASYYVKNSYPYPDLFSRRVHFFFENPLFEELNDRLALSNAIPTLTQFSIYAFFFQYCSSCDQDDEQVSGIVLTYSMKFCDFVNEMDDDTLSKCQSSVLVTIMNSLYKIYSAFDLLDALPIFMIFLARTAKSKEFEKQLAALKILNAYASSTDEQIVEHFDTWKEDTDVVDSVITDPRLEILQASEELIKKVIQDEELFGFILTAEQSYITLRYFVFRLVSQIMVERFDKDTIMDILTDLPQKPVDIEFLTFLLMKLFQSNNDEILLACEEIVDLIFLIGENNLEEFTPKMILFFKELNAIDHKRNNPNITLWRINVLSRYIQMLKGEQFTDRTCIFLAEQLEELRRVSLLQPSTTPFPQIEMILDDTLPKAQQRYLYVNNVSEALIRLFYILVLFRNIKFIMGEPNHIRVREPSNYEFFDFALAALLYTNNPSVADVAIDLYSQFFSQTSFFPESITILYNFCIQYLIDDVDPMAKYRILKLIYKVLIDLESDYELIDFENRRRNHRNDTKGKMKFKVIYGETDFEIYAKPNSTASQLVNRIAMRLLGTANMIKVTDADSKIVNTSQLVHTLKQPLSVICLPSYQQVKYSSASFALWNQSFTSTLLEILENSSEPELTHITKKLLSFLPCDHTVMHAKVDEYLKMINDAKSIEKFKYLLHCINHFTPDIKKQIEENLDKVWDRLKSETVCLSAVFEFFLCVLNSEKHSDYTMFMGGRCFRALYLHDKKSYQMATDLYTKTLTKYININDDDILKKMLTNCNDEEWPYLKEIFKSLQTKDSIFTECIKEVSENHLTNKYIIKLLAMYVKEVMSSSEKIEPFLDTINYLDDCDAEELIDVMSVITDLNIIRSREHFQSHQEELNKMITLAFKKGSLKAEELILNFYRQFETIQSQSTSNILRQFFDQKFDVWNYKSSEHIQNPLGVGLRNLQATSYVNSLFQVFNRLPEFLNEIFASSEPTLQDLQWVLASLQTSNRDFIDPSKFILDWTGGWNGQIVDPKEEKDVTEFFHFIMNDCPESAQDLFKGELFIEYTGDNFEKQVTEPFFSISVPVRGFTNLIQSINSLIEPQIVSDFDDGNENKITVSKLLKITKCPKILVIQLNRFEFDTERQKVVKNNQRFEFPEHLNIIPLRQEEENAFYSLHSIICHSEENNNYYTLGHKDKAYHKVSNIFTSNDEKWISIHDKTIVELPNGYKEEAFGRAPSPNGQAGNAYLLFYVLDDFISESKGEPIKVKIGDDLYNTIQKENEVFGTMQTLFSIEVAKFLQQSPSKDPNIYYLYNILMHGSLEFKDYINDITKNIDFQTAIGYTDQNFTNFLSIFEKSVPQDLISSFTEFACVMMEKKDAVQILRRILDVLSLDQIAERAITPLLLLVYSYLKVNGAPEDPFDIINKLVEFIVSCCTQNLNHTIKIDNALLSLAELLKWGKNNNSERLHNSCDLSQIEQNYGFIQDHLNSIKSLHDFIEQAVKYDLMKIDFFFQLSDIDDRKLANVLNETNYSLIGQKYPDKVNDILSTVKKEWDKTRLDSFASKLFPDGILNKEQQSFAIFFLANNFYQDTDPITRVISNSPLNVEILEKIIVINSIQNIETYNYIMSNIQSCKDENDVLSLIKMNQYLVGLVKVHDLFKAIFSSVQNQEAIVPRFEAFVSATRYISNKDEYRSILDLDVFKKYENILKSSPSYNEFSTRT